MAADSGATVCATRDYHPIDHVCFTSEGGPFPAHSVQGTNGTKFLPPIAKAHAAALEALPPPLVKAELLRLLRARLKSAGAEPNGAGPRAAGGGAGAAAAGAGADSVFLKIPYKAA